MKYEYSENDLRIFKSKQGLLVKEIFLSIQGEGGRTGRTTTFVRLAGCNLKCSFCDTDFSGGVRLKEVTIVELCKKLGCPWVCITGGEPLIQKIDNLVKLLRDSGFFVQLETNGTLPLPKLRFDWISVSPKEPNVHPSVARSATEVKLLWGVVDLEVLRNFSCDVYIQPVNGMNFVDTKNFKRVFRFIRENPRFNLSVQLHKLVGVR